jgi:hypothetical protein
VFVIASVFQILEDMVEPDDGNHLQSALFEFLDCRQLTEPLFLAVERYRHGAGLGANRGAGGDHVVDDHDAAGNLGADGAAALAVILGFLAIEGVGQIASVLLE